MTGQLVLCGALLGAVASDVAAQPTTQLPPVGSEVHLLAMRPQDPQACGRAVIAAAERLRGVGGAFNLPANCPKWALPWPYEARRNPDRSIDVLDTLDGAVLVHIPPGTSPAPTRASTRRPVAPAAGAPIHMLEVGR